MALSVALPMPALEMDSYSTFSSFGLDNILGMSHSSPSPSVSSESSGIGSLGSLKSESVDSESVPASPQTTDKKAFPIPVVAKPEYKDIKIIYQGKNIVDLLGNIRSGRWNYRPAQLPSNNVTLLFENRSQYHRLGPYGQQVEYATQACTCCGFPYAVENK